MQLVTFFLRFSTILIIPFTKWYLLLYVIIILHEIYGSNTKMIPQQYNMKYLKYAWCGIALVTNSFSLILFNIYFDAFGLWINEVGHLVCKPDLTSLYTYNILNVPDDLDNSDPILLWKIIARVAIVCLRHFF